MEFGTNLKYKMFKAGKGLVIAATASVIITLFVQVAGNNHVLSSFPQGITASAMSSDDPLYYQKDQAENQIKVHFDDINSRLQGIQSLLNQLQSDSFPDNGVDANFYQQFMNNIKNEFNLQGESSVLSTVDNAKDVNTINQLVSSYTSNADNNIDLARLYQYQGLLNRYIQYRTESPIEGGALPTNTDDIDELNGAYQFELNYITSQTDINTVYNFTGDELFELILSKINSVTKIRSSVQQAAMIDNQSSVPSADQINLQKTFKNFLDTMDLSNYANFLSPATMTYANMNNYLFETANDSSYIPTFANPIYAAGDTDVLNYVASQADAKTAPGKIADKAGIAKVLNNYLSQVNALSNSNPGMGGPAQYTAIKTAGIAAINAVPLIDAPVTPASSTTSNQSTSSTTTTAVKKAVLPTTGGDDTASAATTATGTAAGTTSVSGKTSSHNVLPKTSAEFNRNASVLAALGAIGLSSLLFLARNKKNQ